ncbi:LamG domain-containing protein [Sedimentisphaera salicampi]|uniref:LamG-like jellyroll fold domain-containing protein n=1 Tax=Sedimentisphaera salicampi TaxID=1941349 RepID=A0A1W6LJ98_9BACT|nr:LamG domain-containing protein [Sedimentisphaera salicampi]ARN55839.1 hypothetical protein STSP1_00205 [Sedimentisphaera salicampi]
MSYKYYLILVFGGLTINLQAGFINHWNFEQGQGDTVYDTGSNPHNGTLNGSATWKTGDPERGTCAEFPVSGYPGVDIYNYNAVQGTNAFSIAGWIKTTDSDASIIGWGDPYAEGDWWKSSGSSICVAVSGDNKLRFDVFGGMKATQASINDGEWHHFAVSVKENATIGDVDLYLDGALQTNFSTETETTAIDIKQGQHVNMGWGGWSPWFTGYDGLMDDMRIYDHALSSSEVMQIVPEPVTLSLLSFGALALRSRKKNR